MKTLRPVNTFTKFKKREKRYFLAAIFTGLLLAIPHNTHACSLVIRAGAEKKARVNIGGYCQINGKNNPVALSTGPEVRRRAFVTNSDGDSLSIIDRDTYKVVKTIKVGDYPHHTIVSLDGRRLYIGNTHSDTVTAIDLITENIVETLPLLDPYNFYYTPDRSLLVTTCTRLGRIEIHGAEDLKEATEIKGKGRGWKRLARIHTGRDPNHFAFSPDGHFMYVSNEHSHQLSVIDLWERRLLRQVNTGRRPVDVALAPGGKSLFVANYGEGYVTVYDTESFNELKRIKTGAGAHGMATDIGGKILFVSNRNNNSVSAIDISRQEVIRTFKVPQGPDMLEVTPDGQELWVTGRYGGNIYVVDLATGKVTHRIRTGASPHGIVLIDLIIPPR